MSPLRTLVFRPMIPTGSCTLEVAILGIAHPRALRAGPVAACRGVRVVRSDCGSSSNPMSDGMIDLQALANDQWAQFAPRQVRPVQTDVGLESDVSDGVFFAWHPMKAGHPLLLGIKADQECDPVIALTVVCPEERMKPEFRIYPNDNRLAGRYEPVTVLDYATRETMEGPDIGDDE